MLLTGCRQQQLGKAVIKGTRIGVDLILEKIGAGETIEDLLKAYLFIKRDEILPAYLMAPHLSEMKY